MNRESVLLTIQMNDLRNLIYDSLHLFIKNHLDDDSFCLLRCQMKALRRQKRRKNRDRRWGERERGGGEGERVREREKD